MVLLILVSNVFILCLTFKILMRKKKKKSKNPLKSLDEENIEKSPGTSSAPKLHYSPMISTDSNKRISNSQPNLISASESDSGRPELVKPETLYIHEGKGQRIDTGKLGILIMYEMRSLHYFYE